MRRIENTIGTLLTLLVLTGVMAGVLALTAAPADAGTMKKGEVILCNSKVRVWEDGSADCFKPLPYKWRKWNGLKVGQYIKCDRAKDVEVDNLNSKRTQFWAHCDD